MDEIEEYEIEEYESTPEQPRSFDEVYAEVHGEKPTESMPEQPASVPVDTVIHTETVEEPTPEPEPEPIPERIINPIFVESIEVKEVPIYEVQGISDADKMMIVKNHMGEIIGKSGIPYIPARVLYKMSSASPPLTAIVKLDHTVVQEAWDYYKVNVKDPNVTEFFEIVRNFTRNPEDVFTRVVDVNLT